MPRCRICGNVKGGVHVDYDSGLHFGLGLLRLHDRKTICESCHGAIQKQELLVLHTQLPLPGKKWDINKGVFVTKPYLADATIAPYTGKVIKMDNKIK